MIRCFEMRAAIAVAVALWMLAGCGSMQDMMSGKRIDYKSTRSTPPLEIPPDLSAPQYDDRYVVASASDLANRNMRAETREKTVLPGNPLAHIERAGSERWLVAKATPANAWETLRQFWIDTGFVLAEEKPMIGIMETDWAENRAEIPGSFLRNTVGKYLDFFFTTYKRDKFRSRIEEGKEPGTVEIYLSHRGMEQVPTTKIDNATPAAFAWALLPPNPELEAEMLMRIMVRFGATEEQAKTAVAQNIDSQPRANLDKKDGGVTLMLVDDFDRAWRRVGLALDRTGFTVTDRDRSQGLYYVRYADPDVDIAKAGSGGWLSKLAFWRKDEVQPKNYQVHVAASGDQSAVTVTSDTGAAVQSSNAEQILTVLQEQLK